MDDVHAPAAGPAPAAPPAAALDYAPPPVRARRRWRSLDRSVAVALVACGAVWGAAPCLAAAWMVAGAGRGYSSIPDYVMALLWATAGSGLGVVLLAMFLCAPARG